VFVGGGVDLKRPINLTHGTFVQTGTPCAGAAVTSSTPPLCDATATAPVLDAAAPAVPGDAPAPTTVAGCKIFSPGKYTTAPILDPDRNYFKSGVYYFDFAGVWDINKTSVVAGTVNGETTYLDAPCYNEATPDGQGAEWVFRNSAALTISNSARVEVHARRPASPDGTPGISVFVLGTRAGAALDQLNGNPQAVFHGTVYSPNADIGTNATGGVSFYMLNGVVANRLLLQSTGNGLLLSTEGGTSARNVLLTATASRGSDGRTVVAHAVVTVEPDNSLQVLSRWSD
jgi:uncharacterized membrane protein (UPF0136 family)